MVARMAVIVASIGRVSVDSSSMGLIVNFKNILCYETFVWGFRLLCISVSFMA